MADGPSPYSSFLARTAGKNLNLAPTGPVDAFDPKHPRSLFSLLPIEVASRINNADVQQMMKYTDTELEEVYRPSIMVRRLRTAFWLEYDRCVGTDTRYDMKMDLARIVAGTCALKHFKDVILPNNLQFGYMLRVPPNYLVCLTEALEQGANRLREILDIPLYKTKGFTKEGHPYMDKEGNILYEPDHKAADLLLKAFAMLDLRVKGAVPQKLNIRGMMDRRNVNVNVDAGMRRVTNVNNDALEEKILSIEDLDKKLAQLSDESRQLLNNATFNQADMVRVWEKEESTIERPS